MENDLEIIRRRLFALKYSRLRKAAKRHSINANQKKEVLVTELSKVWKQRECNKENIAPKRAAKENISPKSAAESIVSPEETVKSKVNLSYSSENSLSDTLNQTFIIEQNSGDDIIKKCSEELSSATEGSVEKKSTLYYSEKVNDSISSSKLMGDMSIPRKGIPATRGAHNIKELKDLVVARFAALHQKLVEKQPTLQEADANVKRRFAEHEKAVPDIFRRLATPKISKKANPRTEGENMGKKFTNVNADPSKMDFSFSRLCKTENISAAVQSKSNDVTQSKIRPPRRRGMIGASCDFVIDVKELTKNSSNKEVRRSPRLIKPTKCVTVPQLSKRLERLATPRGKISRASLTESEEKTVRKSSYRYLPYRGRIIPYVDTTKMTDSQFHEAKMRGQLQTFTAVSTSRAEMRQQVRLEREWAREQILRARRDC
uniref:SAP domain-containing protein n=1 Tax=Setaria digitata TaxID=48799 RepID=A0A915PXR8_9BILA